MEVSGTYVHSGSKREILPYPLMQSRMLARYGVTSPVLQINAHQTEQRDEMCHTTSDMFGKDVIPDGAEKVFFDFDDNVAKAESST